ncbi:ATP-dependent zinc metalloprotease FtsH [Pelosinus baikalensis]|uniref:ATP-dependent zinc metalloprotease FtsH n=1 Tax=Pelosinus baikalensis TaxID=2892015 RepID=A0ABS8HYN1_9FIRM|nr:ATP-dependent zinc metalloprotease FtsH [Pelosinus baikalensis]
MIHSRFSFKRFKRLVQKASAPVLSIANLPMLLSIGDWLYIMKQIENGKLPTMPNGEKKAKLRKHTNIITFKDVEGNDEAKLELKEILEFIKHPRKFSDLGARIPKGVLLYGPPGTGKTLMAKALAGEAGVPFLSMSGSEFVEMYVGVGASRVRDLFKEGRKKAPCIIFIDEIDAVGRQRGAGVGGGNDEREQTLNQLLVEMDGFDANKGIFVVAATNRTDILDPALLRPGRFDRRIVVDRPDLRGRLNILKVHTRRKPLADKMDLEVLARRTPGFTGADLSNVVNEAAILAVRQGKTCIEMDDMEEAVERVVAGPERKGRFMNARDKKLTAYHEAGHVLVAMLLRYADPIHRVSIIPRGQAGGYTLTLPKEDRCFFTRSEIFDQIKILLGGRASESLIYNETSTGVHNDLIQATELARKMVCEYGMSDTLGPVALSRSQEQVFLGRDIARGPNNSQEMDYTIDKEIHQILENAYEKAEEIIKSNLDKLRLIATTLLEREKLDGEELSQLLGRQETDLDVKNE